MNRRCVQSLRPRYSRHVIGSIVLVLCLLLLMSSCGGGLGGSGDGGGANTDDIIIPLPDTFDQPYKLRKIPRRLMAKFPDSLSTGEISEKAEPSAYELLTSTVTRLTDQKIEIGLLQLVLDANWDKIIEFCSATPDDTKCSLQGQNFISTYTSPMASWEYLLRVSVEMERSGSTELTDDTLNGIEELVIDKIGTELKVDSGSVTKLTSGSYDLEINTTKDLGSGITRYTLHWSEDQALTLITLTELDAEQVEILQSSTNNSDSVEDFNNSILYTTYKSDTRVEHQLNLNQYPNSSNLKIESQLTEIGDTLKEDHYFIGNANDSGGYVKTEFRSKDDNDIIDAEYSRIIFNADAIIESHSICQESESEAQCDTEDKWQVQTTNDPVHSPFFLTPLQIEELEPRLTPFNLNINGVNENMDVLVLVNRENLTISISSAGIVITIPGLGTYDLTGKNTDPNFPEQDPDETNSLYAQNANRVLCRSNKAIIDGEITYRSFCAGSTEDIENALVIGESFKNGELVIEWQANATIEVIDH